MQHIGRTHRISVAWLHDTLKGRDAQMLRADSELMAVDIFTKHFPEGKRDIWASNLDLINIIDSTKEKDINYAPSMVRSLRGDFLPTPVLIRSQDYEQYTQSNWPTQQSQQQFQQQTSNRSQHNTRRSSNDGSSNVGNQVV